jgi:hypothetical protein
VSTQGGSRERRREAHTWWATAAAAHKSRPQALRASTGSKEVSLQVHRNKSHRTGFQQGREEYSRG